MFYFAWLIFFQFKMQQLLLYLKCKEIHINLIFLGLKVHCENQTQGIYMLTDGVAILITCVTRYRFFLKVKLTNLYVIEDAQG